jgi:hypothetical protein
LTYENNVLVLDTTMQSNKFLDLCKSHLWEGVDVHLSNRTRLLLYFTSNTQVFRSLTHDEEKILEEEVDEYEYECDDGYDKWDEEYNDDKDYDWYHMEKYECDDRCDEDYNDADEYD